MSKPFFSALFLSLFLMTGCKKFLDVRPDTDDQVVPRFVEDYEKMLNAESQASPNFFIADLMSDDVLIPDERIKALKINSFYTNAYLWAPVVWRVQDDDESYNGAYRRILPMNIIIKNIDKAKGGTEERRRVVRAQAKINRAYEYSQLVNLYGNAYNSSTADRDLAVPMVTEPDAEKRSFRATVTQVYHLILSDLQDALDTKELPDFGIDVIHPGKAAAYALKARVHLLMGDYIKAAESAEAALMIRNTLLDYNTFSFKNKEKKARGIINKPLTLMDYQLAKDSVGEVLFAKIYIDNSFVASFNSAPLISDDLATLFGPKDLRYVYNFSDNGGRQRGSYILYGVDGNNNKLLFNYSISVSEMMLIKAEYFARINDVAATMNLLNELRRKRFAPVDYVALTIANAEQALKLVLEERRRELFFHGGMRIFDLKRLNLDPRFKKDIQRISDKNGAVISVLTAGSPRYLLPFAPKMIANNAAIIQNPR